MKNLLKVIIPKPCEKQEWSSEFISNREQLCLLCSEKVFDATALSDNELHKLVSQKDRPKCMKFKTSQLNRPLVVPTNTFNYKQLSKAFYGMLVAGLVVSCSVQKQPEKSITDYEHLFETDLFFSDTLKYVIRGIVIDDETKEPATKCFVKLDSNGYGVWSDEFGRFKLKIPKYFIKDTLRISISGTYNKDYFHQIDIIKTELPTNKIITIEPKELIVVGYYEVKE